MRDGTQQLSSTCDLALAGEEQVPAHGTVMQHIDTAAGGSWWC